MGQDMNGQEISGSATNAQGLDGSAGVQGPDLSGPSAAEPAAYEVSDAPQNWAMVVVMLAIVAGLAFGGVAMMYRRAEASKREAEIAMAMVQTERDRAEVAQKEARAQQRLADQLRDQVDQAGQTDIDRRAEPARPSTGAAAPKADAAKADTAVTALANALSRAPVDRTPGGEMDMRTVLDAAALEIESGQIKGGAAAAGAVHSTLGNTYLSLGDNAKAAQHLRLAIDLRRPVLGEKSSEIVKDEAALARANAALKK